MTIRLIDGQSHPHDELPKPFRRAVEEILAEPVPQVNLARIRSRLPLPAEPREVRRSWPMRIAQLALAGAAAAVVVVVALRWMQASNAWAQAIKQVREARSMSYSELITLKGQPQPARTRVFIAEDGRKRSELLLGAGKSGGVVTIFDAADKIRITLIEDSKLALVHDQAKEERGETAGRGFLAWLQTLKELGDKPDKELGQKELEGKRVTGFVATQGNFTFTMWVDNATRKPVRIEYDSPVNGPAPHVVMSDFRFDEKLDESLFSFAVPAGYKVRQQPTVPSVPGGEASVVEALRGYTKRAGGRFPSSLTNWGPWAVLFSKGSGDGTVDPEATRVMGHLGAILPFLVSTPKDDYAYLGEGKTVDQKDAVVFWYKRPDGTYRAIYGDLSVKDISAENLPKK